MRAVRLPDGRIRVPIRAESHDGKSLGDGAATIGREHPQYVAWDAYLRSREQALTHMANGNTGEAQG